MCRLFGFRSLIPSQVHNSLVSADNALMLQSEEHPDGWGVSYYIGSAPHIIKSVSTAIDEPLFQHVSGIVSSETVIAHLRKATQGSKTIINTHPFQYGSWVFAHNGNVKDFGQKKELVRQKIAPKLRRFILGETDSESFFYLILTHLERRVDLHRPGCSIDVLAESVKDAIDEICDICGPYSHDDSGPPTDTYLSFVLTNGSTMLAHHGGKDLFYSTFKNRCSVRDLCPSLAHECEHPTTTGFINHLIFSSEPLQGENVWLKMSPGQMVGIDWRMQLHLYNEHGALPLEEHAAAAVALQESDGPQQISPA